MEYNSQRPDLILHEYGRNIQNMVTHAVTLQDREERNSAAKAIVEVIGNLNPHLRDNPDYRHKLWDHLFIMSNFELDVDSPYPKPQPETFTAPPDRMEYPTKAKKFRHYGQIVLQMIDTVCRMDPGEERSRAELALANHMKKTYLIWNKDNVEDSTIYSDLREMSFGKINLSDKPLISSQAINQIQGVGTTSNKRPKKYSGGKGGFKKNKRYNKPNNR
ncbi:MAG: DUF4290 domain-containing protein [Cryomorphaceae bacterium]|nr:DUF4290 domain-containing protein [Cryomorphaceae bacterium]